MTINVGRHVVLETEHNYFLCGEVDTKH